MMIRPLHVSTVSNGQVAPGGGATLWSVNVNTAAAGAVLKIYNDVAATAANLVAVLDASQVGSWWFGVYCDNGIFYDLSVGTADITIGFS